MPTVGPFSYSHVVGAASSSPITLYFQEFQVLENYTTLGRRLVTPELFLKNSPWARLWSVGGLKVGHRRRVISCEDCSNVKAIPL